MRRWRVICSLLAITTLSIYCLTPTRVTEIPDVRGLRSGDIVCIRGMSFRSNLVNLFEGFTNDYTHVGLVVLQDGHPFLIHADPSNHSGLDRVIMEPWAAVLTPSRIKGATVFRLTTDLPNDTPKKAAESAFEFFRQAIPFDHDFDLGTPERLYCTELVWRAYVLAGVDLMGSSPVSDRRYLFPDDLIRSGLVKARSNTP